MEQRESMKRRAADRMKLPRTWGATSLDASKALRCDSRESKFTGSHQLLFASSQESQPVETRDAAVESANGTASASWMLRARSSLQLWRFRIIRSGMKQL